MLGESDDVIFLVFGRSFVKVNEESLNIQSAYPRQVLEVWKPVFWKRSILGPFPLLRFRFRFHQNVVILLVAIPPTHLEAAEKNNRFRFRFQNPAYQFYKIKVLRVAVVFEDPVSLSNTGSEIRRKTVSSCPAV